MAIEHTNIFNNENFISVAGSAAIGGTALALAGYDSKPWLKNGLPSDTFVKNVEAELLSKSDKDTVAKVKAFDKYIEQLDKAQSFDEIADFLIKSRVSASNNFEQVKKLLQEEVMSFIKDPEIASVTRENLNMDYFFDYYNGIKKCADFNDLKYVMIDNLIAGSEGYSFEQAKKILKAYETMRVSHMGVNIKLGVKEAVQNSYDSVRRQFVNEAGKTSKEIFNAIKKTASNMQCKTAALWGLCGGAAWGGLIFLINKLCSKIGAKSAAG